MEWLFGNKCFIAVEFQYKWPPGARCASIRMVNIISKVMDYCMSTSCHHRSHSFEKLHRIHEDDNDIRCPSCGCNRICRLILLLQKAGAADQDRKAFVEHRSE